MQGASALQAVLDENPAPVDLFVVWEPVLEGDAPPSGRLVSLLRDRRVWQLWDGAHRVSDEMRVAMMKHPSAISASRRRTGQSAEGVLWDAVAVFPSGAAWGEALPCPVYLDGDVIDVAPEVANLLRRLEGSKKVQPAHP